ncbi:hypothetical protein [Nakamurella aerolata]|uniref:Uncharacterized protein n=1 Tax=Nakamurella aerolata TaxID=1656892 RepID=A0A849A7J7_9ACTN|nr:hypothetical protein [Nakamurella aerolata]NNG36954.1 hypothetical protein [Nakamurella aerolata]
MNVRLIVLAVLSVAVLVCLSVAAVRRRHLTAAGWAVVVAVPCFLLGQIALLVINLVSYVPPRGSSLVLIPTALIGVLAVIVATRPSQTS